MRSRLGIFMIQKETLARVILLTSLVRQLLLESMGLTLSIIKLSII